METTFNIIPIPVSNKTEDKVKIPEPLPRSHVLFSAPTSSGKSTLILNMILRDKFKYNRYFKDIYYVSPTIKYDDNFEILEDYKPKRGRANVHLVEAQEDINSQLKSLLEDIQADEKKKRLIILDDCIHLLNNSKVLQQLLTSGRHNGITSWITTQSFRKINKTVRNNCIDIIIFKSTESDLKGVIQDISEDKFQVLHEKYKEATAEPYQFLHIRTRAPAEKRYTASFKRYI